jgi:transcription termination/antitermination protein NusG
VTDEPNKLADEATDEVAAEQRDATANGAAGEASAAESHQADVENVAAEVASEEPSAVEVGIDETADSDAAESEDDVVEEEVVEEVETNKGPVYLAPPEDEEIRMDWYILKVQSNRERSIAEALERKIKVEGLDRFFDQVIVPTEKVTEFKGGKKKVVERKLYPGYIVVHMHINDDTWFAVRDTSGVGDFTGAGGKPTPMLAHEVSRIVQTETEETEEAPKLDIKFSSGDKVKVKEGNFENFEGEVGSIDEASGRVTVMINIFGRSTPVELEYWQIEAM